jgi:hypothetical protein
MGVTMSGKSDLNAVKDTGFQGMMASWIGECLQDFQTADLDIADERLMQVNIQQLAVEEKSNKQVASAFGAVGGGFGGGRGGAPQITLGGTGD